MAKLRDLRINANMSQSQVADLIKTFPNVISNYESGALPDLEDASTLSNYFKSSIDWPESLTQKRKFEVMEAINGLAEVYPLAMVFEFAARVYRREIAADSLIIHYANRLEITEEPMITPGLIQRPCDCED